MKKYICELFGTCFLVFFGCGTSAIVGTLFQMSPIVTPWAFGIILAVMVYAFGSVSGCHVNPAVSLAMWLDKRISAKDFVLYVVFQFIGAFIGAALLFAVMNQSSIVGQYGIAQFGLGANGFEDQSLFGLNMTGAIIAEVILTFVFVLVVLAVTANKKMASVAGVVIGLALVVVHIIGIPLTGTSVNPARSFGPALMMFVGAQEGAALGQLWVFIVAPLIGGALAACFWKLVCVKEDKPKPAPKPVAAPKPATAPKPAEKKETPKPKPAPKTAEKKEAPKPKPAPKPAEKKEDKPKEEPKAKEAPKPKAEPKPEEKK